MKFWERMKNLWELSGRVEISDQPGETKVLIDAQTRRVLPVIAKKSPATIVSMEDPLAEFNQEQ